MPEFVLQPLEIAVRIRQGDAWHWQFIGWAEDLSALKGVSRTNLMLLAKYLHIVGDAISAQAAHPHAMQYMSNRASAIQSNSAG